MRVIEDSNTWMMAGALVLGLLVLGGMALWYRRAHHAQLQRRRRKRRAAKANPYPPVAVPDTTTIPSPPTYRGRRPLILLVDDSETMLRSTSTLLEERQYRVLTAENGKKAWSMLQDGQRPDAVITDIDMPMMNGLSLLRLIRSDLVLSDLPVILMTGDAYYHVQAGREEGLSALLSKPFKSDDLYDQLRFVLQE